MTYNAGVAYQNVKAPRFQGHEAIVQILNGSKRADIALEESDLCFWRCRPHALDQCIASDLVTTGEVDVGGFVLR